ncbi:MAG: CDP-diacylglycerol--glycerol-3-phosphate 3-phosphatidyltransferase [Parachlamydiaceae bacterium]
MKVAVKNTRTGRSHLSLANYLTLIRLFIGPMFLLLYLNHENLHVSLTLLPYLLLFLFVISEISDVLDGYLARKYNEVTDLGKILDPMADSIYRISLFLTFTLPPVSLPMIYVFVLLYRDLMISTLRTICALKGIALAARTSGKIKAVIQAISAFMIILLLIPYSNHSLSLQNLHEGSTVIICLTSIYTFFSGIDYLYANRKYIYRLLSLPKSKL